MTIQSRKGAVCLVVLDDVGQIRAKCSSALNPSLLSCVIFQVSLCPETTHWRLCAGNAHWIKTYIKDGLLWVLVAAEDKEGAKVVGLDKGKVASVV